MPMSEKTSASELILPDPAGAPDAPNVSKTGKASTQKPAWRDVWRVYAEAATLRMLLLGFSAGLPLLLVFGTLSFWLREAGI